MNINIKKKNAEVTESSLPLRCSQANTTQYHIYDSGRLVLGLVGGEKA